MYRMSYKVYIKFALTAFMEFPDAANHHVYEIGLIGQP